MSPKDSIDIVIRSRDGSNPASSANTNRRVQLLDFLNHLTAWIHNYREWSWTWTSGTITFTTGNRTSVLTGLANFMEFGQAGGLFDPSTKRRYTEISTHMMDRIRFETTASNQDYVFCVRGENIEIPAAVSSNLTLTAVYRRTPEIYTDHNSVTAMLLPDRYCRTVLVPGLTRAAQQSKSDARLDWASELRDGLSRMCANDNPMRTSVQRWPIAIPGAW